MKTPIHLEIPSQTIQIGEDQFVLQEMTAARTVEYAGIFDKMLADEKADPMPEGESSESEEWKSWFGRNISRANAPLRFLLARDDEWIEQNMVRSTKDALLRAQRELNQPEASSGNASSPGGGDAT